MKVKIEIDLDKTTHEWLQKLAESLTIRGGIEELLSRELTDYIDNIELWLDRYHILHTRKPSLFSERLS